MIKKVRTYVYVASDGERFQKIQDAYDTEVMIEIKKFLEDTGIGCGGLWDESMIAQELFKHRERLRQLLNEDNIQLVKGEDEFHD